MERRMRPEREIKYRIAVLKLNRSQLKKCIERDDDLIIDDTFAEDFELKMRIRELEWVMEN